MNHFQFSLRRLFFTIVVVAGLFAWLRHIDAMPRQLFVAAVASAGYLAVALMGGAEPVASARTTYYLAHSLMGATLFYTLCNLLCLISWDWHTFEIARRTLVLASDPQPSLWRREADIISSLCTGAALSMCACLLVNLVAAIGIRPLRAYLWLTLPGTCLVLFLALSFDLRLSHR